jgi:outer membrane protein insertion porin family
LRANKFIFKWIAITLLLSGCVGARYLKEDEKLLYKQQIKGAKNVSSYDLENIHTQRPNRRILKTPLSPYVWVHGLGKRFYNPATYEAKKQVIEKKYHVKIDAAKSQKKKNRLELKSEKKQQKQQLNIEEGNRLMRYGEPVAVFDSTQMWITRDRFRMYLISKGYFQAQVEPQVELQGKRLVKLTYHIKEGKGYKLDTVFFNSNDSTILRILAHNKGESHLKKGENYDQQKLTRERERIDLLLKDHGYYNFSRQYIDYDVDTAFRQSGKVGVRISIKNPQRGSHRQYVIDSVTFTTDTRPHGAGRSLPDSARQYLTYRGITFRYFEERYNKKVLARRVFLQPDSLYSRTNTFSTQRQLANLDNFRFININYDSADGRFIANIFTSPLDIYQWSNEFGINVTQGYPGPFYNLSLKRRNVFKGLEIFEINGRIGIEGVAPVTQIGNFYRSTEAGLNVSLTFPQFLFPFSEDAKNRFGRFNPKSRMVVGYTYTDRPEYKRAITNFSKIFSWQNENNVFYNFTVTDINLINSQLDSLFNVRLLQLQQDGNNLINSFNPSFVSSMMFSASYNINSYGMEDQKSAFIRIFAESGGTSLNLLNDRIFTNEGLEYYKYMKLNVDIRKNQPLNYNTSMAMRFNAGVAYPYSVNGILPYEKYFFAGGSNGIRAWRPRRLGPGSYTPLDENGVLNYNIEQPAEILLEGSLELRKNLIGFLDYAVFFDVGNVWTLQEEEQRKGANFAADRFFREIAIGSGLGLRFDFSFLILRLDAGLKMYDPARPYGSRFIFSQGHFAAPFDNRKTSEPIILNIGIGYPF